MDSDEILAMSVSVACKRWGLSRPTLYKLLADPECPAFKIGKKWVIPIEQFDEYMYSRADRKAHLLEGGNNGDK